MKSYRLNYLLIVPFQDRWRIRKRLERGEPVFGGLGTSFVHVEQDPTVEPEPEPAAALAPVVDGPVASFEVLGLAVTATKHEVKKRFKKLARQHHPDHGGDANKFRALMEAKVRCLKFIADKIE